MSLLGKEIAVIALGFVLTLCTVLPGQPHDARGVITGVVVNGTQQQTPLAGAAVVLRVDDAGSLIPIAEATTDSLGRFRFENLPVMEGVVYLPGANHDGIHYPGPRVRFGGSQISAAIKVVAYDSVAEPCPLVALRHDITLRAETGVLQVTESLLVANPTKQSYVGLASDEGHAPVTLRLAIPPDFEKVTFDKEFFGRQFKLVGQTLETDIPWTPGEREVKFTYLLPLEQRHWVFQRPLDLPCSHVRVTVARSDIKHVSANLPTMQSADDNGEVVFESQGTTLPAGHVIELQLGSLPVPWTTYARWIAVAVLAVFVTVAVLSMQLRRRHRHSQAADDDPESQRLDAKHDVQHRQRSVKPRGRVGHSRRA
jgi:hypothetical protein